MPIRHLAGLRSSHMKTGLWRKYKTTGSYICTPHQAALCEPRHCVSTKLLLVSAMDSAITDWSLRQLKTGGESNHFDGAIVGASFRCPILILLKVTYSMKSQHHLAKLWDCGCLMSSQRRGEIDHYLFSSQFQSLKSECWAVVSVALHLKLCYALNYFFLNDSNMLTKRVWSK